MKKLQCELCGSIDLVKNGDYFVCQSCGAKYTPEEARNKININVNVSDNGITPEQQIDNYKDLAANAYKAGNNNEAYSYCQRILELDTKDRDAWYLKGLTSALMNFAAANFNLDECIHCFNQTLKYVDSEESRIWEKKIPDELEKLVGIVFSIIYGKYGIYDLEFLAKLINDFVNQVNKHCFPVFIRYAPEKIEPVKKVIANTINNIVCKIVDGEFFPQLPQNKPSMVLATDTALDCGRLLTGILKIAAAVQEELPEKQTAVYDNIIKINESLIVSLKYGFNPNNGKYESILKPDNAVVNHLTDIIMEAHAEIKKINPKHRIPSRSRYTGSKVRIWIILVIIAVVFLMIKSCS